MQRARPRSDECVGLCVRDRDTSEGSCQEGHRLAGH
jgi:hypothetical protein